MRQQREDHKTRWGDINLLVMFPKIRDEIFGKTERLKDNLQIESLKRSNMPFD